MYYYHLSIREIRELTDYQIANLLNEVGHLRNFILGESGTCFSIKTVIKKQASPEQQLQWAKLLGIQEKNIRA